MKLRHRSWLVACLVCGAITARAQAQAASSKEAAAEIFFQEGVTLVEQGAFAKACAKFEASQRLDPALGTLLRLADCYDRSGKTASAWQTFKETIELARERNDVDRLRLAEERCADAEARLAKLKLSVDRASAAPGTTIHLNGVALVPEAWQQEIPVDPGPQRVEVSAPERLPWSTVADVPAGPATRTLNVPGLALAPDAQARLRAAGGAAHAGRAGPARTWGYVLAGTGVATLAAGAFLAYGAKQSNEDSLAQCRPDDSSACTEEGVEQREAAKALANGATAAFVSGAALAIGGVLLAILGPSRDARQTAARRVRVSGGAGVRSLALRVEGRW
jgi:tetratricopeptide (TPR) repeat protein